MMGARVPPGQAGFALVNALVIIVAISVVATGLMHLAAISRTRAGLAQDVLQVRQYLDALQSLSVTYLGPGYTRAPTPDPVRLSVPIDRGSASVEIADLQGRFNINGLASSEDPEARAAFARLIANLDLPPALGDQIAAYVGPGSLAVAGAYARRPIPVHPPGEAIALIDELRLVQGMNDAAYLRLIPHVTALPGETAIHANSVTAEVLAAMIGDISVAEAEAFLKSSRTTPFDSLDDFEAELESGFSREFDDLVLRFSVSSDWFEARLSATVGETRLDRRVILQRDPTAKLTTVAYRRPGTD